MSTSTISKRYMTASEAAKFVGITEQALANQRHERRGFPYIRMGGRVMYDMDDITKFMDARKISFE